MQIVTGPNSLGVGAWGSVWAGPWDVVEPKLSAKVKLAAGVLDDLREVKPNPLSTRTWTVADAKALPEDVAELPLSAEMPFAVISKERKAWWGPIATLEEAVTAVKSLGDIRDLSICQDRPAFSLMSQRLSTERFA